MPERPSASSSTWPASPPWSARPHGSGIVPAVDVPDDLRYSPDHEWVRVEAGQVRMGITDYAQDALGDIVFVQVPSVGTAVTAGSSLAEVESTKSVSEVYAPVTGTVTEVNDELGDAPERLNDDPYGAGWICVIDPADPPELDRLLDAPGYRGLIGG
jgi:glycine cleavage system H protein